LKFVILAVTLFFHGISCGEMCSSVEPGGQHGLRAQVASFFCEENEDGLRHIFGGMWIAGLPKGGGVD